MYSGFAVSGPGILVGLVLELDQWTRELNSFMPAACCMMASPYVSNG